MKYSCDQYSTAVLDLSTLLGEIYILFYFILFIETCMYIVDGVTKKQGCEAVGLWMVDPQL
jgi:hypothetical protein